MLHQLQKSGHLRQTVEKHHQLQEKAALVRLLRIPARTFLHDYDVLFRYVSLWLLGQGYALTNRQPHQVLRQVCELFSSGDHVREVVRSRHALKYHQVPPSSAAMATIACLLIELRSTVGEAANPLVGTIQA